MDLHSTLDKFKNNEITIEEAKKLVCFLKSGELPFAVKIVEAQIIKKE